MLAEGALCYVTTSELDCSILDHKFPSLQFCFSVELGFNLSFQTTHFAAVIIRHCVQNCAHQPFVISVLGHTGTTPQKSVIIQCTNGQALYKTAATRKQL